MFNIFPEWLYQKLVSDYVQEYIYEVRIRVNKPIVINYKGCYQNITNRDGYNETMVIASFDLINYIVSAATKHSLYAYNHQIKQGFITTDSGIRIGLCGVVVYDKENVSTIKSISSLNIRISHKVCNCSEKIINFIYANGIVKNTLVISPPGAGKTTIIRDIVTKLSNEKKVNNILVVDERYEIAGMVQSSLFDIGNFVDVVSGSNKSFAFNECLKTMSPSVIVTDEISKPTDIESVSQAIKSGVKVIASAHAENVNDLKFKPYLKVLIENKYFERIIVLSKRNGVGTIECVYDENLRGMFLPYML